MTLKNKRSENLRLHAGHTQPHAEDHTANHTPSHDEISRRAYEIHVERGGIPGHELEDWLQAESELRSVALFVRAARGEQRRP